jgi:hypothetical protein
VAEEAVDLMKEAGDLAEEEDGKQTKGGNSDHNQGSHKEGGNEVLAHSIEV